MFLAVARLVLGAGIVFNLAACSLQFSANVLSAKTGSGVANFKSVAGCGAGKLLAQHLGGRIYATKPTHLNFASPIFYDGKLDRSRGRYHC